MVCWRFNEVASNVTYKRIYHGPLIKNLDSSYSHLCGLERVTNRLKCWQWPRFNQRMDLRFSSIAVGEDFVCGILEWGNIACMTRNGSVIGNEPKGNYTVIGAASRYACAISVDGRLDCWGNMSGQIPQEKFSSLALGENRSCALGLDRRVICWGWGAENNFSMPQSLQGTKFLAIEAKKRVFCGILYDDYSLQCWGSEIINPNHTVFDNVLPGPCRNQDQCPCEAIPGSARFCDQGVICKPCDNDTLTGPAPCQNENNGWSKKMVVFVVVGCVGSICWLLIVAFLLYQYCKDRVCRVHNSGRLDETADAANLPEVPQAQPVPAVLEKRLSHIISMGNGGGHLEEFPLKLLQQVTNNFSDEHKIGTGSFGSVYHATLEDGKEIAIKRAEISSTSQSYAILGGTNRQEDKDSAFVNELESLSRLNHKNLVRLLGFFEDSSERILVYEYMNNGSLIDHLHNDKLPNHDSPLMSWIGRIKVALDAARGIQYLHEYATPPIIHRDIKSSNILLDAKFTAKVSDFGLSQMGSEDKESHLSLHAVGTFGYMDPEYYRLQYLTTKSDIYSFGVVLLELLTGNKAIHKNEKGVPRNLVDFMVPYIVHAEIHRVLDPRIPPPTPYEIEAVAYVGYLAGDCVRLEGRERPTMSIIVNNLEKALAACVAQPVVLSRSTTDSSAY
ncbi:hypothetical protein L6164_023669 [Bauhinia variegata]|nr:hypothetical protein L6164_023669 [Bauhinia variegata]